MAVARLESTLTALSAKENPLGTPANSNSVTLRRTAAQDLDSVVALDAANVGRARQFYFERRLKAALAQTALHVQFSAEQGGKFVGFMMARQLLGEFGRAEPALRLEAMGVAQGEQGHGIGTALLAKLESEAKRMGVPAIRTMASWRDHAIMQFFDRAGFELSQNLVIDCAMHSHRLTAHEGDKVLAPAHLDRFFAERSRLQRGGGERFRRACARQDRCAHAQGRRYERHRAHRSPGHRPQARGLHPGTGRRGDDRFRGARIAGRSRGRHCGWLRDGSHRLRRFRPRGTGGGAGHHRGRPGLRASTASVMRCCRSCS